jgi:hypothetical protein
MESKIDKTSRSVLRKSETQGSLTKCHQGAGTDGSGVTAPPTWSIGVSPFQFCAYTRKPMQEKWHGLATNGNGAPSVPGSIVIGDRWSEDREIGTGEGRRACRAAPGDARISSAYYQYAAAFRVWLMHLCGEARISSLQVLVRKIFKLFSRRFLRRNFWLVFHAFRIQKNTIAGVSPSPVATTRSIKRIPIRGPRGSCDRVLPGSTPGRGFGYAMHVSMGIISPGPVGASHLLGFRISLAPHRANGSCGKTGS